MNGDWKYINLFIIVVSEYNFFVHAVKLIEYLGES